MRFGTKLRRRGGDRAARRAWLPLIVLFAACGKQTGVGADGAPWLDATMVDDTTAPPFYRRWDVAQRDEPGDPRREPDLGGQPNEA